MEIQPEVGWHDGSLGLFQPLLALQLLRQGSQPIGRDFENGLKQKKNKVKRGWSSSSQLNVQVHVSGCLTEMSAL